MNTKTLPALTIRQPWAALIMSGHKPVENRNWRTGYRGEIAIHAGKQDDDAGWEFVVENSLDVDHVERGAMLGTVVLKDIVRNAESDWARPGQWHWILTSPQPLEQPIPFRGRQSLWLVDLESAPSQIIGVCATCVTEVLAWDDVRDRWVCAGCGGEVA
jgi:hypothetical protein